MNNNKISVRSAFDMIHRHNVDLHELIPFFPELKKFEFEAKTLNEKLRVEGTYGIEHKRLLVKVKIAVN